MKWYTKYLSVYGKSFIDIPLEIVDEVKDKLAKIQSKEPAVTVSVIAYNEEKYLLACLWSLSEMHSKYPVEIIGVDNDSKDCTEEIFKQVGIPYYVEKRHSCGWARLCGLEHAKGMYHINIDSDTVYPPSYIDIMIDAMSKKDVVGVSSLWSYIPDKYHSPSVLFFYELMRDIYLKIQSFKRSELSVRGLVFAYRTEPARKVGIRTDIIRGEDGYLAFQLKQFGKIKFIHNRMARPITGYGTVGSDGSIINSFKVRVIKAIKSIGRIFYSKQYYEDHDDNIIEKNK